MAQVVFRLKARTCKAMKPRVVGNCTNLGGWDVTQGCEFSPVTGEPGIWKTPGSIFLPLGETIEYKYVLYSDTEFQWEAILGNRRLPITANSLLVDDEFGAYVSKSYVIERNHYVSCSSQIHDSKESFKHLFLPSTFRGDEVVLFASVLSPLEVDWDYNGQWHWTLRQTHGTWAADLYSLACKSGFDFTWVTGVVCPAGAEEQKEALLQELRGNQNIWPVFLPEVDRLKHAQFCEHILEPIFHGMIGISPDLLPQYSSDLWDGFRFINLCFARAIMQIETGRDVLIWLHDFSLLMTPSFLSRQIVRSFTIGFSFHHPFPPADILKVLPHEEVILNSVLSSDLLGFESQEYAKNFLGACQRRLGSKHSFGRNGRLAIEYSGRQICVHIGYYGLDPKTLKQDLSTEEFQAETRLLLSQYQSTNVYLSIDPMNIFSGIQMKISAFADFLSTREPSHLTLLQICVFDPISLSALQLFQEAQNLSKDVNQRYGRTAVKLIRVGIGGLTIESRLAYYSIAKAYFDCSGRASYSNFPLEFAFVHLPSSKPILLSEFAETKNALKSAIVFNPFFANEIVKALKNAEEDFESVKGLEIEDWERLSAHTPGVWAAEFLSCLLDSKKNSQYFSYEIYGFGDSVRLVAFRKDFPDLLSRETKLIHHYKNARSRLLLFSTERTFASSPMHPFPSSPDRAALEELCKDERNSVYLLSSGSKTVLEESCGSIVGLGLVAEMGCMIRDKYTGFQWEKLVENKLVWKELANDIIDSYVDRVAGAWKETGESYVSFIYLDADPEEGLWHAKELVTLLETALSQYSGACEIVSGAHFVLVKPANVSKGLIFRQIRDMVKRKKVNPDFILAIGDSVFDEELFKEMERKVDDEETKQFSCVVGKNPTGASYYLDNTQKMSKALDLMKACSVKVWTIVGWK